MRPSIDGLASIVENELERNPLEPALFVFCNRAWDKIKILYWENNGFVLWYKRLEKQKFKWLDSLSTNPHTISGKDLNRLLDGLKIFTGEPHEALFYEDMS